MDRFYGLSDAELDRSKVNQREIKYKSVILLSVDVKLLVQRENVCQEGAEMLKEAC